MKLRFFSILIATLIGVGSIASAQYADLPHDRAQWNLGLMGGNDRTSLSSTFVAPVTSGNFMGWIGTHATHIEANNELVSRTFNVHIQGGLRIEELRNLGVEAFLDVETDHENGVDSATQIGAFFRPGIYENTHLTLSGGVGNFLENTNVRQDLELEEADSVVSRWLAYASLHIGKFGFLGKLTPTSNFKDMKASIEGNVGHSISESTSLRFHVVINLDSDPVIKGNGVASSYVAQIGINF